ncbi:hypothetical protein [Streptomyces sp. BV129]|uniref:hypothetical protein n=1 Tax=Streptomyces sp. BV129 TaxID=2849671 RepID=UPI001C2EE8E8|nr:hypothetical protein [Streptomyces sp. BV129]MBV1950063.1 hypothetical protein [Streptomyces sp. BV129]
MGSLRNPVGPLPSSIYWRRRVVMVSVVALLALVVACIVVSGGGGGKNGAEGPDGKNPASTITPGPSSSGPAISQHPGGRDESGSGGGGDGGSGDGSGDGSGGSGDGSGGDSGSGSGGSGGSGGPGSASGTGGGNVGSGDALAASSPLPVCAPGKVTVSLRSKRNSYSPDETPTFELVVRNTASGDCKVDLGPEHAVLAVTPADGDDTFWASDDCAKGAKSLAFRVPAGESITYTVKWDRRPSAPECATPPAGKAKPGTYLLEAKAPGFSKTQTSFVLSAD